jgi:flagellar biosynthesis/type III secretory pathway protein FliH
MEKLKMKTVFLNKRRCCELLLLMLLILVITVFNGCDTSSRFNEGYENGKDVGYREGLKAGKEIGYANGKSAGSTQGYRQGFEDGRQKSYEEGRKNGIIAGYKKGYELGFQKGHEKGKTEGENLGFNKGYDDGYKKGYKKGETKGYLKGTKFFIEKWWKPSLGFVAMLIFVVFCFALLFVLLKKVAGSLKLRWEGRFENLRIRKSIESAIKKQNKNAKRLDRNPV